MKLFQIGTCKGNDDLTEVVMRNKENIELLVLVEPMSRHNNDIIKCYQGIKNVNIENIVIHTNENEKIVDFFYHDDDGPLYEVASLSRSHITKHNYADNLHYKCACNDNKQSF